MKKIIAIFLTVFLILSIPTISYANDTDYCKPNEYIEYFSDGSYSVTTIESINVAVMANSSVSKYKTITHYSSKDEKEWEITITGTFTYTGSSATCTNSTVSYTIYDKNWKVTSAQASKSGRTATGEFTLKRYFLGIPTKTVNETLTLTCSNTGVCS